MVPFLEFVAIVGLGGVSLFAFLGWIKDKHPGWRNTAGFFVGLGSAYAGSFALDLFIGASTGFYHFHPLTIPVATWTGIAVVLYAFTRFVSSSRRLVAFPYFTIGGIATMAGILGAHRYSVFVGAPLIFFALVFLAFSKQATPQTGQSRTRQSFQVGQYKLDATVEGVNGLTEFSASEYAAMGRQFEGEKNFNAPPVTFLGRQWKLQLGTVHGKIYKIAPYLLVRDKKEANSVATDALRYCTEKLGKPSEEKTGLFVWDTSDGNVILQTADTVEGFDINLYITSKAVRSFKRKSN